jgi:hypothetical protein
MVATEQQSPKGNKQGCEETQGDNKHDQLVTLPPYRFLSQRLGHRSIVGHVIGWQLAVGNLKL